MWALAIKIVESTIELLLLSRGEQDVFVGEAVPQLFQKA